MGYSRYDAGDWDKYTRTASHHTKSTKEIFTSKSLHKDLDPRNIKIRESRDSAANPASTPVIIAADETGSMGILADAIIRTGMPTMVTELYNRKPVTDPHILCMGIGDAEFDSAPLQVSQFESEATPLIKQLEQIYLESNGGGNSYEGYSLAWLFAALRTSTDSFEKRGKKGYLFTLGDENPTPRLRKKDLERIFGENVIEQDELSLQEVLTMASRQWEVYHIIIAEGNHCRFHGAENVHEKWKEVMGQRAILLQDYTKLGEVIVSTIQVVEGEDRAKVAASWNGDTSMVVADAIKDLSASSGGSSGLVSL